MGIMISHCKDAYVPTLGMLFHVTMVGFKLPTFRGERQVDMFGILMS